MRFAALLLSGLGLAAATAHSLRRPMDALQHRIGAGAGGAAVSFFVPAVSDESHSLGGFGGVCVVKLSCGVSRKPKSMRTLVKYARHRTHLVSDGK
jgi:hypothetical protein